MANNTARIAEIRDLLASGASSTNIDGVSTTFDLDSLRRELRRLEAEDDTAPTNRPRVSQFFAGGF